MLGVHCCVHLSMHVFGCVFFPCCVSASHQRGTDVCACVLVGMQVCHVLQQVPPRPDSLRRLAGHRPLLTKTVALAKGAECVAAVEHEFVGRVPRNTINQTQFWQ